ncbi:serine hydrolase domain-containing protein [Rhodococcus koreensis]|jgi:CubicO group peptidase (beta-lactamase class C family)|uniref:serine hydrolase domain-containing protein n=1 Tax=Rhodococcus koreensis TaxID=99653 RepID=UPI001980457E|nr:serine hydrolase [Rhodococcus koreensis]QSE81033.1 serine hydrolase [Rhodococcus koreensis]
MTDKPTTSFAGLGFFTGIAQHENFCQMATLLPSTTLAPSSDPYVWPTSDTIALPEKYEFGGATKSFEDFFVETDTAALLVLVDGAIRHERYALTGGPDVPWISMSVAKSFISTLVGIAVEEGHIKSIDDPISDYVPVNPGSAYDGVPIKQVLLMSSGARWNEDYNDSEADVFRLAAAMDVGGSLDEFVASAVHQETPGTLCRYNSGDTQVLGALLVKSTKRSITDYMQEKLYEPLGMTSPGHWLTDSAGMEAVFACLNMTARDFAKIGELYRNGGRWQGKQIVPEQWVRDSVVPSGAQFQPGQPIVGTHRFDLGYGYQWWIPAGNRGEFSAIGVYNQFVYVDPSTNAVIVKLSANRAYGTTDSESTNRESETVAFLRSITNTLRD